jgi:predicted dehydrogenase
MSVVAIVGCGGIGIRHAQAAIAARGVTQAVIVEPNADRLEAVRHELVPRAGVTLEAFASLDKAWSSLGRADIVIAAVTADVQAAMIERLLQFNAGAYLFEKPFAQSATALEAFLACIRRDAASAKTFINCSRNMWAPYVALGERQCRGGVGARLHIEVFGPLWGLGCNAVHFLELLRYITAADGIACEAAQLAPSPYGNKRGRHFEEFVGTASFRTAHGDTLQLTSSADPAQPAGINVMARWSEEGLGCLIEEDRGIVYDLDTGTRNSFAPLFVRATTQAFIEAVVENRVGAVSLPSVQDAAIAHRALFQALERATGRHCFDIT